MSYYLFFYVISTTVSLGVGYIISKIRNNRCSLKQEIKIVNLTNTLQDMHLTLNNEKNTRKQTELTLKETEIEQRNIYARLAAAEEKVTSLTHYREECRKLNQELTTKREIISSQAIRLHEATIRLEESKLIAEEKLSLLKNSEQRLSEQFENLANRIFENNGRKVNEHNKHSLDQLLIPLREQLEGLNNQIQNSFNHESQERHTLTHEIRNLQQLHVKMTKEAINLTQALKGDNKIQGNWGEMILKKVLESSGLREGHEFEFQIGIKQDNGRRLQPDVIVRLPKNKDIIIDAKISLVAYERYFNSDNDNDRRVSINEHINSIRSHIKLLGRKNYQQLSTLRSLDYVLMFVPIEPAFIIAINRNPELISEALAYNVMLASPTTLLVALRTINNLWRYEHQNLNAQKIADRATRLYDKLRLFIDDINDIGYSLHKAQESYLQAKNKLYEGRGNIIGQAEKFSSLGVEIKKPINSLEKKCDMHSDFNNKK